jgi:hypothetical protein
MAQVSPIEVPVSLELTYPSVLKPGDTLIISTPVNLNMHDGVTAKNQLEEMLPGVRVVIVDNCNGMTIYRDKEGE